MTRHHTAARRRGWTGTELAAAARVVRRESQIDDVAIVGVNGADDVILVGDEVSVAMIEMGLPAER